jgi:zinc and cadmium transporter
LISIEIGIITWLAAAGHEIPQEFGDFGILLQGGWDKGKALIANYLSAFTIVIGGLVAYYLSNSIDTTFLLPFAAGNFIYIAAADLIPEVSHTHEIRRSIKQSMINFIAIIAGIALIVVIRLIVKN